jgi:uncharacterized membrane protein
VIEPHEPLPLAATVTNTIPEQSYESHPSVATTVVEELPPTPKPNKRETLSSVSNLLRKRTRSERFGAIVVLAPIVTTSELSQKLTRQTRRKSQRSINRIVSEASQNTRIAATTIPSPTVNATKASLKRKRQPRIKSRRGIDRATPDATIECPNFADTQTPPDFMEVRIPGFTLCKEFQETIFSLQAKCT